MISQGVSTNYFAIDSKLRNALDLTLVSPQVLFKKHCLLSLLKVINLGIKTLFMVNIAKRQKAETRK